MALIDAIGPQATLFIGDDRTDEDGFAVLGEDDVAIRCGGGETIAPFALENADAVAVFLARLVALRSQK
jgi:trehalose 6-phosphate phosphatase